MMPRNLRVLGVRRLPDVATVSRILAVTDGDDVAELRRLCRQLVLERLGTLGLRRVTLDFDGCEPYQLEPAPWVVLMPRVNLLIAVDTGLGSQQVRDYAGDQLSAPGSLINRISFWSSWT